MDDLADGVYAAVGAPRTNCYDRMTRDESKRVLHRVLNRDRMDLRLPTCVIGAVILDYGNDARQITATSTGQRFYEPLCFLFLTGRSLVYHFIQDAARSFRVAHIHVGPSKVQFGSHLAHGDRL